ncbi:MAG: glycoside hydrolase family 2 TIM barrel-domain containing protein [Kiritimatiellae bacterium]|jgi:hypothetical protein|nr:glycoside hydrolase family 2 TIM barrel-domain containing protein [Kiritimatiellia bacterium]MDD3585103.1 glycoside hydrolase family 2 TIM barrel-domain containing protein [Kiritimatiellia bacterium]HON47355.1 glycoside hydrolase family 2 TIM barrel-domain containing protein [Kiritimatiellia bacterium]
MGKTSVRVGLAACVVAGMMGAGSVCAAAEIPLPEHPRPDFQRSAWQNLNGAWGFRFDKANVGIGEGWAEGKTAFPLTITVPFGWGSALSGVKNEADIGWYRRTLKVPEAWRGQRVFLVVGASDWHTTGWLDGQQVGVYQGGYTPFAFDLTDHVKWGAEQTLVLRVDDTPHGFRLTGKQGYGNVRGVWQTAYLEARPATALERVHFVPDIDAGRVRVKGRLSAPAPTAARFTLAFKAGDRAAPAVAEIPQGQQAFELDVPLADARLWSLEDPYLYEVTATLACGGQTDTVATYFGMRKISVVDLPGLGHPYIALNNKPLYLKLALDQSYHPDGYYTFPTDAFMRDEILRSRSIGLNGQRIHIKVEVPRKLYWADRLGMLIMADVPNSWGEPDAPMRAETEVALRGMIERDMNHPCVFSWVVFNETWGLRTKNKEGKPVYLPETQEWVASMVKLAKALDPSRLVEDNSPCNHDHVVTDINSWHAYRPGYKWEQELQDVCKNTFPGSTWNYIGGRKQGREPLLNSECGNVWGYKDSTGDVDWSWDYHLMMDAFRRHPQCCGWLYTEHHDVINEWNGYWKFDRSEKLTGIEELVPGMTLRDWHGDLYVAVGKELCREERPGAKVSVPLYLSALTDRFAAGQRLVLRASLRSWDAFGVERVVPIGSARDMTVKAWQCGPLDPLEVTLPAEPSVCVVAVWLEDVTGHVLVRNFTTFAVRDGEQPRQARLMRDGATVQVVRVAPKAFTASAWSMKQWDVFDGLKVNGAGKGFFEYRLPWPAGLRAEGVSSAVFMAELSAKRLNGKDTAGAANMDGDYMRGLGTHDPSRNPNSYPMTDTYRYAGAVRVSAGGRVVGFVDLPDDPADHRGILSWQAQKQDGTLSEAGSYGYLVSVAIPQALLAQAAKEGHLTVRIEADEALASGLAVYGERFGRYPLDPSLVLTLRGGQP